jgi:hypothetical protein
LNRVIDLPTFYAHLSPNRFSRSASLEGAGNYRTPRHLSRPVPSNILTTTRSRAVFSILKSNNFNLIGTGRGRTIECPRIGNLKLSRVKLKRQERTMIKVQEESIPPSSLRHVHFG